MTIFLVMQSTCCHQPIEHNKCSLCGKRIAYGSDWEIVAKPVTDEAEAGLTDSEDE